MQAQRLLPPAALQALLLPVAGGASDPSFRRADPRLAGLPPPMIPGNFETRTMACAMQVPVQPTCAVHLLQVDG